MKKILVAYASKYGSTKEVAQRIAEEIKGVLGDNGEVDLMELKDVKSLDGYDGVVMGAALYMFRWHNHAIRFLKRFEGEIKDRELSVAAFALGPVKDPKSDEEWKNSQGQLDKALAKFPWFKPVDVKLFGGKFDPESLGRVMRVFAQSEPATDIRDWDEISKWAKGAVGKLK